MSINPEASDLLSGGDYDVDDAPIRRRWPVVDFASGPERPDPFASAKEVGNLLDLEPQHDVLLPTAPAIDFGKAPGRDDGPGASGPVLDQLLDLHPQPEQILPRYPAAVIKPDPRQPRTRPKRWPVVRSENDELLESIERAIDAAGPPPPPSGLHSEGLPHGDGEEPGVNASRRW